MFVFNSNTSVGSHGIRNLKCDRSKIVATDWQRRSIVIFDQRFHSKPTAQLFPTSCIWSMDADEARLVTGSYSAMIRTYAFN